MYPGEYPQPLTRVTNVQCAVTSGGSAGYVAARLKRQDPLFTAGSGDDTQALFTLQNVGSAKCTVQVKQTNDYSTPGNDSTGAPTGTRFNVGSAVALVAGGQKAFSDSPWMQYLEVWSTFGASELRMMIDSRIRYDRLAFDKSETINDPKLFNIVPVPVAAAPGSSGPFA
jgi:hypothetical protein